MTQQYNKMIYEYLDCKILYGSDDELRIIITESPRLPTHDGIVLLSESFLAKVYRPDTLADTLKAVEIAQDLNIRTPDIIRTVYFSGVEYLVMERVQGTTLEEAWAELGWCASLRLAIQVRRYICSMRSLTSKNAGSLDTGESISFWLDDTFGLPKKATAKHVNDFLAFWTDFKSIRHEQKKSNDDHAALKGSADLRVKQFVLTHHDLAPRNIMVDAAGDAWLIDWDYAGYYPVYFEYASMWHFREPASWGRSERLRWRAFSRLVAGSYEKQRKQLEATRFKFRLNSDGRRHNLVASLSSRGFQLS